MSFLIMDLEGLNLSPEEIELLEHPGIAGVILFQRNYQGVQQLEELIRAIRGTSRGQQLLLSVDQEGGRVQRLTSPFTHLPAPGLLTQQITSEPAIKLLCHELGWLMATELLSLGIDISFAPVLDVDIGLSEVIGTRSFGSHADTVIDLATAYTAGMNEAGMAATAKHFPGHGGVVADSHIESPIDQRSFEQLHQSEMRVFEALIQIGISGVMPSHVIYNEINGSPACFSEFWLRDVLRAQLHFDGCIFSDDLSMHGAKVMGSPEERANLALEAGCDALLCCNDRASVISMLDSIKLSKDHNRSRRISAMKSNTTYNPSAEELLNIHKTSRYQNLSHKLAELDY